MTEPRRTHQGLVFVEAFAAYLLAGAAGCVLYLAAMAFYFPVLPSLWGYAALMVAPGAVLGGATVMITESKKLGPRAKRWVPSLFAGAAIAVGGMIIDPPVQLVPGLYVLCGLTTMFFGGALVARLRQRVALASVASAILLAAAVGVYVQRGYPLN